jgi:hypothetical protein
MKKVFLILGGVSLLAFTSVNAENSKIENKVIVGTCGEGQTEVKWSFDCPDGNYSGSICIASEDAMAAAKQISTAECP